MIKGRKGAIGWVGTLVTMVAIASVVFFSINNKNFSAKNRADKVETLYAYLTNARDNIVACGLLHPKGDNGTGFNIQYPKGANIDINSLECPGNPVANKNLWSGVSSAAYLQPLPIGFSAAKYTNDAHGIKVVVSSQTSQADVFELLAKKFAVGEIDHTDTQITFWIKK